jgi:hypothetical protein
MPLSGPPPPSYCSQADAIAVGASCTGAVLDTAIFDASRIVDSYCDTLDSPFGVQTQKTISISDVRKPMVPLPTPFSNVTSVALNGGILDPSTYVIEEWGIRLYSMVPFDNGWPVRGSGSLGGTWPYQASGAPYGSQVDVTAFFGRGDIPRLVARGAALLTRNICNGSDGPYERNQIRVVVGQYQAMYDPKDPHPIDSTGDAEVDRLLFKYRRTTVQVR